MATSSTQAPFASPVRLLRTKLYIPLPHPDLVEREALASRLDEGLCRRLVVVVAPAGSGKTTLLSAWAVQQGGGVAWVSLDENDNDPLRFWAYAIAALQNLQPGVGETALAMLGSPQPPPLEFALTELLNDLADFSGDATLIFDDYHTIHAEAIHQSLAFWVEKLPPMLHLVLAGRSEPPLPLARWRGRRELLELQPADLRFSYADAAALLNQVMALELTAGQVAALERATEGWAAGLQLAALSMRGVEDVEAFIHSFSGSHRYIFDYLAQEVLNRQTEGVQNFLICTSILERLTGPLCDEILQGIGEKEASLPAIPSPLSPALPSQQILESLERLNLFIVPLDQQRRWYRYHHLFAEFLHTRLEQRLEASQIAGLHRRASAWLESQGLTGEAIQHAAAAGDTSRAVEITRAATWTMFERSELITLIGWLKLLPPQAILDNLALRLIAAWAHLATSQFDQVEPYLEGITSLLGVPVECLDPAVPLPAGLPPVTRGALAEVCCLYANLGFHRMDPARVVALSQRALELMGQDVDQGVFQSATDIRAVIRFNLALVSELSGQTVAASQGFAAAAELCLQSRNQHLAIICLSHLAQMETYQGRLRQARQTCQRALVLVSSRSAPYTPYVGQIDACLGELDYEANALLDAGQRLAAGIERGRQWANLETLQPAYLCLARLLQAQGDAAGALRVLDEAQTWMEAHGQGLALGLILAQRAMLRARQGDPESARRMAAEPQPGLEGEIPFVLEAYGVQLAQAWLFAGLPRQALGLSDRLLAKAEGGGRQGRVIQLQALRACALRALGQPAAANAALLQALRLAQPEGYLRTFIDLGEALQPVLLALRQGALPAGLPAYVDELLAALSAGPLARPATLPEGIEPLSPRSWMCCARWLPALPTPRLPPGW